MTYEPSEVHLGLTVHDCESNPSDNGQYLALCFNGHVYQWRLTLFDEINGWITEQFIGQPVKWAELPDFYVITDSTGKRTDIKFKEKRKIRGETREVG